MILDYEPRFSESFDAYANRIIAIRSCTEGVTWQDVADTVNYFFKTAYSPDKFRKMRPTSSNDSKVDTSANVKESDDSSDMADLLEVVQEMKKERMKLSEQNSQMNSYLRTISREETIKEIAKDYAATMSSKKLLKPFEAVTPGDNKIAILNISDWHYGAEVNSVWNVYNPDICKERVNKLRDQVIQFGLDNKITELVIVNLSDLISGNIHLQLRVQSRINVIQQVMDVSEILAEFIHSLSEHFHINYFDCIDNHSRINPNKKESIQLESLTEIIHWYLKNRFENHENINILDNALSRDIIAFDVMGWKVAAVHGDLDKQKDVVQRLSLMTKRNYDLILTGHLHHFSCDERNECVVVSNPSLMGTDDFAQQLRASSKPAQNLIVVTEDSPVETIKRILL